jgi:hypothetical protein
MNLKANEKSRESQKLKKESEEWPSLNYC